MPATKQGLDRKSQSCAGGRLYRRHARAILSLSREREREEMEREREKRGRVRYLSTRDSRSFREMQSALEMIPSRTIVYPEQIPNNFCNFRRRFYTRVRIYILSREREGEKDFNFPVTEPRSINLGNRGIQVENELDDFPVRRRFYEFHRLLSIFDTLEQKNSVV